MAAKTRKSLRVFILGGAADPVSVLWTSGAKAERLMDLGRLDASRALDGIVGEKT
jgi:hypothetical protein